jgi:Kef-type K+ transport system membrane component KefB
MPDNAKFILVLGGILLLSMATDALGQRTFLPRVSLLVIIGIIIGPGALNLIPPMLVENFDLIATMALLMIGFLLGGKLTRQSLLRSGNKGLWISLSAAVGTSIVVFGGLSLIGVPADIALLLSCIASATAPAATFDIVMESKSDSAFSELLLMVVALDDIWGLFLFSFALAAVSVMHGLDGAGSPLLAAAQDIGGGAAVGLAVGLPGAFLTGRIKPGQPILTEALGLAFLCGGLALWTNSSFLIASMVMGAVIANLATHHEYPFHAIEDIEWPFMVIFFVLAGASLELGALQNTGLIGLAYIVFRVFGKILGAGAGTLMCRTDGATRRWMGMALLPQAGVAMGMALAASIAFPEYRSILLPIVIGATVIFEIAGPIFTRLALTSTKN